MIWGKVGGRSLARQVFLHTDFLILWRLYRPADLQQADLVGKEEMWQTAPVLSSAEWQRQALKPLRPISRIHQILNCACAEVEPYLSHNIRGDLATIWDPRLISETFWRSTLLLLKGHKDKEGKGLPLVCTSSMAGTITAGSKGENCLFVSLFSFSLFLPLSSYIRTDASWFIIAYH